MNLPIGPRPLVDRTARFTTRRLAVIDLYGERGTARRRRLVLAEFVVATLVSVAIGIVLIVNGGVSGWLFGLWLVGIGANYLALSIHAITLRTPERLAAEAAAIPDFSREARYYSIAQARLVIPGLVALIALRGTGIG